MTPIHEFSHPNYIPFLQQLLPHRPHSPQLPLLHLQQPSP